MRVREVKDFLVQQTAEQTALENACLDWSNSPLTLFL
jgi:hypothetical protein